MGGDTGCPVGSFVEQPWAVDKTIACFPICLIPEVKRLGQTLNQWRYEFLDYFDTDGVNNGGTEAIDGLIELHCWIVRASATETTAASACSSPETASAHDPTRHREEPETPRWNCSYVETHRSQMVEPAGGAESKPSPTLLLPN